MTNYASELSKIKKGDYRPLYLFLGTEAYFMEEAKQVLLQTVVEEADRDLNVGIYNMEETALDEALADAESLPFFGDRKVVLIENPYFLTAEKGRTTVEHDIQWLEQYVNQPSESTLFVIFAPYEKLDARKKLSKLLMKKAVVVDVAPLDEKESRKYLADYIRNQGYQIDRETFQFFFERVNHQLSRGVRECSKLFLAAERTKKITRPMVTDLVARDLEQNVFELVEYVLKKDVYRALQIYRDLLLQKEDPIKINAILTGQFRLLLQVQLMKRQGYQQNDIAKALKIHPYRIKLALQQSERFSQKTLARAYHGLVETDYRLKTGAGIREIQFELFLTRFAE